MKIEKTEIEGVYIIDNFVAEDERGLFVKTFNANSFKENNLDFNIRESYYSESKKNVIRGLHLQRNKSQGKFISVIKGKIFDVALDLRINSKTFGLYYTCILSSKNSKSIYIPPGFAHGFQAIEKENYVVYCCTQYRDFVTETSIKYNDKSLNIPWPIKKEIVSKKDLKGLSIEEYKKKFCK